MPFHSSRISQHPSGRRNARDAQHLASLYLSPHFLSFTLFSTTQIAPELAPDYGGIGKQYLPREVKTVPGKKPNKRELARMKVLSDMGESNRSIARQLGKGHGTIKEYLNSDVFTNAPEIDRMVEQIKDREVADLALLGARGRQHIHELLDEGKSSLIPLIALVDRTFQQLSLESYS